MRNEFLFAFKALLKKAPKRGKINEATILARVEEKLLKKRGWRETLLKGLQPVIKALRRYVVGMYVQGGSYVFIALAFSNLYYYY